METIDLQELITERNAEMQEFVKKLMQANNLSSLPIDERMLIIDTPDVSIAQMIDKYFATLRYVLSPLVKSEAKREHFNKRRVILFKRIAKEEKKCERIVRAAERNKRKMDKMDREYTRKYLR